jgi:hypothetical protein
MNAREIIKYSETEMQTNANLLKSFSMVFSFCDAYSTGAILHDKGIFFEKMNKNKAEAYFFNLFMGSNSIGQYWDIEVNSAISIDHIPGQEVLEFCLYPFCEEGKESNRVVSKVFTFAFSFKDGLIYSIRKPKRILRDKKRLEEMN